MNLSRSEEVHLYLCGCQINVHGKEFMGCQINVHCNFFIYFIESTLYFELLRAITMSLISVKNTIFT